MIRYFTAGESHGKGYSLIVEGFPAGFSLDISYIQSLLAARQKGGGRSRRSFWEENNFEILSGLINGKTTGSPLSFFIPNHEKSQKKPFSDGNGLAPRPGHADYAGFLKYHHENLISVIERASGRDTVARTLCGSLCLSFLKEFGIVSQTQVLNIGGCPPSSEIILKASREGTTLGGVAQVCFQGVPVGLGSYVHWDRNIDGAIAKAICSIPGVKGIQFGLGFNYADLPGHRAHDAFKTTREGVYRTSNHAGGIEGGMTNGEDVVVSFVVKPPSSLTKPLSSINLESNKKQDAFVTRSDVCYVEAACIVAQAVTGIEIFNAFIEKIGGDSFQEIKRHYETSYKKSL